MPADARAHHLLGVSSLNGSLMEEKMDPTKRAALCLYYSENLNVTEMSVALNIPKGTVKSRLYAARKELKELKEARVWSDKALNLYPRSSDLLSAKAVLLTRLKKPQDN